MDKRKNYYMVLDTETCNGLLVNDKLDLSCSLVYDIGYAIIDKKGNIYKKASYLVKEIFLDERTLMNSAYYANKIPQYFIDIQEGKRIIDRMYNIRQSILKDCTDYNIKAIVAHNARFDYNALNITLRWLTKSKYRWFFPYNMPIYDTMAMCLDTIAKESGYKEFCQRKGYMTNHKNPRVRVTAEIIYKYISGNYDFIESHTGLEDVLIELEIFVCCLAKHKKMKKEIFSKKV